MQKDIIDLLGETFDPSPIQLSHPNPEIPCDAFSLATSAEIYNDLALMESTRDEFQGLLFTKGQEFIATIDNANQAITSLKNQQLRMTNEDVKDNATKLLMESNLRPQ